MKRQEPMAERVVATTCSCGCDHAVLILGRFAFRAQVTTGGCRCGIDVEHVVHGVEGRPDTIVPSQLRALVMGALPALVAAGLVRIPYAR